LLAVRAEQKCAECSGDVVDAGEELVCSSCGIVTGKEVLDAPKGRPLQAADFTGLGLGGFLGSPEPTREERRSEGLSGERSSYAYLKLVSDYAGREDSTFYSCARTIERVCDTLALPRIVMAEAVLVAKRVLSHRPRIQTSSAAVCAFAVVTACKISGTAQVGVREILEAHRAAGRRVKMSDIIKLSLDAPLKTSPRRPQDCLPRVLARLGANQRLARNVRERGLNQVAYLGIVREGALSVLEAMDPVSTAGYNPWSLTATALYVAEVRLSRPSGRRPSFSQRDAAEAAGVAEYTVRDQYRRIFRAGIFQSSPAEKESPPPQRSS
jgi:transcription initiation factor TFIIIB Brf1 subunit/transcription initiation factor TFIIB